MTTDFKASQVQTNRIIATGSFAGGGANQILVYGITADDSGTPNQGAIDTSVFDTSGVGSDALLFISGGIGKAGVPGSYSVSAFGGDVHISGNLTIDGTYPSGGGGGGNQYWDSTVDQIIFNTGSIQQGTSVVIDLPVTNSVMLSSQGSTRMYGGQSNAIISSDAVYVYNSSGTPADTRSNTVVSNVFSQIDVAEFNLLAASGFLIVDSGSNYNTSISSVGAIITTGSTLSALVAAGDPTFTTLSTLNHAVLSAMIGGGPNVISSSDSYPVISSVAIGGNWTITSSYTYAIGDTINPARVLISASSGLDITGDTNIVGNFTVNGSPVGGGSQTFQQVYDAGASIIGVNNSTGSLVISGNLNTIGPVSPPLLRLEPGKSYTNYSAVDVFGTSGLLSASLINIRGNGSTAGGGQVFLRSTGDFNGILGWVAGSGELYSSSPDASIQYHPNANALKLNVAGASRKVIIEDGGPYGGNLLIAQNAAGSGGGTIELLPSKPNGFVINSGSSEQSGYAKFFSGLSGSLTQLIDGTSYLRAGSGITIASQSNGHVTVSSTVVGGSSADVLWEWNGVDTSQFTITPVTSSGQTGQISVSGINLSTNKAFSTLDLSALWAGAGGAMAFKVNDLTLPDRFRLRLGVNSVPSGIRIGIMFFNSSSWGSNLAGGGITFGSTFLRWVTARGTAAAFPPFDLHGSTPSWDDPGTTNSYNGFISEWDCTIRSGSGGYPPAMAIYGRSHGSAGGGSSTGYTITADRGVLIGSGTFGSGPSSIFNNTALTGLAIIAQSTALGSYTGSFGKIQVLSAL